MEFGVKSRNLIVIGIVAMVPLALFWGCNKGTQPVSPAGVSGLTIRIPSGVAAKFTGAAQNTILYDISGTGAPVTGSCGPISAAAIANGFSFNLNLSGTLSSYSLISVQINDASSGNPLALGVAPFTTSSSGVLVELGPLNKICYDVTDFTVNDGYSFQNNTFLTTDSSGVTAMDIACVLNTNGTAYDFEDPNVITNSAVAVNCIAYMGNGNLVNFAEIPPTASFKTQASNSKSSVLGTTSAIITPALNDVFCVKLKSGGYAWLQITNPGTVSGTVLPSIRANIGVGLSVGPSFVFRLNTTVPYFAYQQSTADLSGACASLTSPTATPTITPTPTITGTPTITPTIAVLAIFNAQSTPLYGLAVSGPANGAATIVYTSETNGSTGWIRGFNISPTPSPIATAGYPYTHGPYGLAVNSAGTSIVVAEPTQGFVYFVSASGSGAPTTVGSSVNDQGNFTGYSNTNVTTGQWVSPYGVALDSAGNVYGTDQNTGGSSPCDAGVMGVGAPGYTVGFMSIGDLRCNSPYGLAVLNSGGVTYIYVTDYMNSDIDVYDSMGISISAYAGWSGDLNPMGNVSFYGPTGVAVSGNGQCLFIADTLNNRVVEWNVTSPLSPSYVAAWGPVLGGSYPNFAFAAGYPVGIAADGATPPNVYVSDTGNHRTYKLRGY